MKLSSLVVLSMALLATACSLNTPSAPPTSENSAPQAPTQEQPATSVIQAGLTTYTDTLVGFAFEYPVGWTIPREAPRPEALAYAITIASYDYYNAGPGGDGVPSGVTKIDIAIAPVQETLESVLEKNRHGDSQSGSPISEETQRTLVDGTPAVYQHIDNQAGYEVFVLVTIIHGRVVIIGAHGEKAYFEIVANSLRPV